MNRLLLPALLAAFAAPLVWVAASSRPEPPRQAPPPAAVELPRPPTGDEQPVRFVQPVLPQPGGRVTVAGYPNGLPAVIYARCYKHPSYKQAHPAALAGLTFALTFNGAEWESPADTSYFGRTVLSVWPYGFGLRNAQDNRHASGAYLNLRLGKSDPGFPFPVTIHAVGRDLLGWSASDDLTVELTEVLPQ